MGRSNKNFLLITYLVIRSFLLVLCVCVGVGVLSCHLLDSNYCRHSPISSFFPYSSGVVWGWCHFLPFLFFRAWFLGGFLFLQSTWQLFKAHRTANLLLELVLEGSKTLCEKKKKPQRKHTHTHTLWKEEWPKTLAEYQAKAFAEIRGDFLSKVLGEFCGGFFGGWILRGDFLEDFFGLFPWRKQEEKIHPPKIHGKIQIRIWEFRGQSPHCKDPALTEYSVFANTSLINSK